MNPEPANESNIMYAKRIDADCSDDTDNGVKMEICNIQEDSYDETYNSIRKQIRKILTESRDNANNPAEIEIYKIKRQSVLEGKPHTQEVERSTPEMTDDASTDAYGSCTSTEEIETSNVTEEDQRMSTNEDTNAKTQPEASTFQEIAHCQLHCKCHGVGNNRAPKISSDPKMGTLRKELLMSIIQEAVFFEMEMYALSRKQQESQKPLIKEILKELKQLKSRQNCKACDLCIFFSFLINEL